MIDADVEEIIIKRLRNTEEKEGVRIIMAIESGSRAWGFASPNSDYDVRFIYSRKKDWYLAVDLEDRRDVIEYPIIDEIDLNGWDVRKALKLFWRSNPAFVEWIQSPITYIADGSFREHALNLLPDLYSVEKGIYHYRSMAKTNYRGYLREEIVPLKKYFYVLRPLFAIKWLEEFGTAAPIEFDKVLNLVTDSALLETVHSLLGAVAVSHGQP
ncbi:MAG: nucleotidyltransferase domain-containing protein [Hahellaceae bacterium]|nr:nucleotidyltransferase domain-containing protein [Hahellaceae bacterium]